MKVSDSGFTPLTPDQAKAKIEQIFIKVYGADVNLATDSLNGYLVQELANIVMDRESDIAMLYNQINPDTSQGFFFDGIAAFNLLERLPATQTIVKCQVTGLANLIIPKGSKVISDNNDIFLSKDNIVIDVNGKGSGYFVSEKYGDIPAPKGFINRIFQQISGWDGVSNDEAGVEGHDIEETYPYKIRRKESLYLGSVGQLKALLSIIRSVKDVKDTIVLMNTQGNSQIINGITVSGKSVWINVYGGTDKDIALAIYDKLSGGCGTDGRITIDVPIEDTPVSVPIKFNRPKNTILTVRVVLDPNVTHSSDISTLIKKTIIENFEYGNTARIAEPIYSTQFVGWLIKSGVYDVVKLSLSADSIKDAEKILLPINEVAVITNNSIIIEGLS